MLNLFKIIDTVYFYQIQGTYNNPERITDHVFCYIIGNYISVINKRNKEKKHYLFDEYGYFSILENGDVKVFENRKELLVSDILPMNEEYSIINTRKKNNYIVTDGIVNDGSYIPPSFTLTDTVTKIKSKEVTIIDYLRIKNASFVLLVENENGMKKLFATDETKIVDFDNISSPKFL